MWISPDVTCHFTQHDLTRSGRLLNLILPYFIPPAISGGTNWVQVVFSSARGGHSDGNGRSDGWPREWKAKS